MTEQEAGPFRDSRVQFGIQPGAVSRPQRAAGSTAEASQKNCHLWRAPLWHQAFAIVSTLSSLDFVISVMSLVKFMSTN